MAIKKIKNDVVSLMINAEKNSDLIYFLEYAIKNEVDTIENRSDKSILYGMMDESSPMLKVDKMSLYFINNTYFLYDGKSFYSDDSSMEYARKDFGKQYESKVPSFEDHINEGKYKNRFKTEELKKHKGFTFEGDLGDRVIKTYDIDIIAEYDGDIMFKTKEKKVISSSMPVDEFIAQNPDAKKYLK